MAWIYHPTLDRTVEVPDSAVLVWAAAGWQEADPPPPPKPEPEPAVGLRRKSQPAAAGTDSTEE
jgi:hypothetical protein